MPGDIARPEFKVYDKGSPIDDKTVARVIEITVDDAMDSAAIATVKLRDEAGELSDAGKFKMGSELKVDLGYQGDVKTVFKGEITGWKGAFPRRGNQTLTVIAQDKFHRLRRNRRQMTYLEMKDSDAVSKAAKEAGLTAQAEATPFKQDSIIQWNQRDSDFILERAAMFGFEVFFDWDKGKLTFRKPKLTDGPVAEITWHKELRTFETAISLAKQQKEVKVTAWDMMKKEGLEFTAKKGDERDLMGGAKPGAENVKDVDGKEPNHHPNTPASSPEEVEAYAQGIFHLRSERYLTGTGSCWGDPKIQRGKVVKVMGIGPYLEGPYYVRRAIHTFLPEGGYTTTFHVIRTAVQAPGKPPPNYEHPAPQKREAPPEPKPEKLGFEVASPAGSPQAGTPYVLTTPTGERKSGELPSDGKVDVEFES